MKNIIRLICFVFTTFVVVLAAAAALSFLQLWISARTAIPAQAHISLETTIFHLRWTVPLSFYVTLLLSTNYALSNKINRFLAFIVVTALAAALTFGATSAISMAGNMREPPFVVGGATLGSEGLMLREGGTVITLIDKPSVAEGGRVVSLPDRDLFYEADPRDGDGKITPLPLPPFERERNGFFESFYIDCTLSAEHFFSRFRYGVIPFLSWVLPLVLLLVMLTFVFDIGSWPLSNLFLSACVFRGIILLEVFLDSKDIQSYLSDFFLGVLPDIYISPAIFAALGILLLLYVILMHFAQEKAKHGKA